MTHSSAHSRDEVFGAHMEAIAQRSTVHEALRKSSEYQAELTFLRKTVKDLIYTVRLCELAASRWSEFQSNYLLPTYVDDIVEAALTAQLAIENGALNPARRELRYMLEVAVNISYVDEVRAKDSFEERIRYYRGKNIQKANVDHISELPLRLLGDQSRSFANHVKNAWVRASNYVHLTKRRVDEKLRLREQGVALGFETIEMLKEVVTDVHKACSIVMVLTFETIGPTFTSDVLLGSLGEQDDWAFHASGYVAIVDSYFDYKHERRSRINEITEKRNARIRFNVSTDA